MFDIPHCVEHVKNITGRGIVLLNYITTRQGIKKALIFHGRGGEDLNMQSNKKRLCCGMGYYDKFARTIKYKLMLQLPKSNIAIVVFEVT